MKKIIVFLSLMLALIMIFSLISCNKKVEENSIQTPKASETKEKKAVAYVIYADYPLSESSSSLSSQIDEKIAIKKASEKEFAINIPVNSFVDKTAPETKTITIDQKEYVLNYRQSTKTVSSIPLFSENSYYDSADASAEFYLERNELISFYRDVDCGIQNELDADVANKKAEEIIKEIYGENALSGYTLHSSEASDANNKYIYYVTYKRYVYGVPSNDDIRVAFNMNGELHSIRAIEKGSLANAEKDMTKEELVKAIEFFNATFSDGWSNTGITLIVDANGDYYIKTLVWKGEDAHYVYINVQ